MRTTAVPKWILAGLFYAATTVLFLQHAVVPWRMFSQPKNVDSLLMGAIADHTSHSLFGEGSFWNFGILYPLKDTLCLSEPMLLPATLLAPLYPLFGATFTRNVYYYLCWFTVAFGTWAYLRHRGYTFAVCLWAGSIAAYSVGRMCHAYGHDHLLFQAGFPLILLTVERALMWRASRKWAHLAGLCILVQVLGGFYVTALFALWCLCFAPYLLWPIFTRDSHHRQGLISLAIVCAWALGIAGLMVPVVSHYSDYGSTFPDVDLDAANAFSATAAGYFLPPFTQGMFATPVSWLFTRLELPTASATQESCHFIGYLPLLLAIYAAWGHGHLLRHQHRQSASLRSLLYGGGILCTVLLALVLSFGPYLWHKREGPLLPFASLIAYVPPLRFIRAPARFGFVVQWGVVLAAAAAFQHLLTSAWLRRSTFLTKGCIASAFVLLFLECFQIYRWPTGSTLQTDFTKFLLSEHQSKPFVRYPDQPEQTLEQLPWHHCPEVGGVSGYYPLGRQEELRFFDRNFPSPESLLLFERWGIQRVFVSSRAAPVSTQLDNSQQFSKVWSGEEGTLYELTSAPLTFASYLQVRRSRAAAPIRFTSPANATRGHSAGFYIVDARGVGNRLLQLKPPQPIKPADYTRLTITYTAWQWYDLVQYGHLSWTTIDGGTGSSTGNLPFPYQIDGRTHILTVPLGESIGWIASEPITQLTLHVYGCKEMKIDSIVLDYADVNWRLPPR